MNTRTRRTHFWPIVLLIVVGSIIYSNTLNVPFHFDDLNNIQNPALKLETLNAEQFRETLAGSTLKSRPISNLSFAFNYFVGRYRVQGYHMVNIGIHICTGIFLYLFLQLTLNLAVNKRNYTNGSSIALLTALLWIAHPVATQSVTYIVQRMNSMAAMFFVLAMLLYATGRDSQRAIEREKSSLPIWAWFVLSGVSGFLAIGSKEIAVSLPFYIFLYEWYFFQDLRWEWLKKKMYWLVGIVLVMGCIAYAFTNGQIIERIFNNCSGREFSTMERVLTQLRVVIHYITLVFYPNPNRLALDYDFPLSISLLSPISTLYSLIAIVALVVLAILTARRERLVSFCILWFFGNLVIESSIICLEIIFEHRTYLPSMFLILLVAATVYRIGRHTVLVTLVLMLPATLLGYWTFERNNVWQNPLALWSDSVSKHPNKARPHSNLGLALTEVDDVHHAEKEFKRALEIDPNAEIAHNNLAGLLLRQGKKQEAEFHFQEAIRIKPDYALARINLGGILRERGQYEEAADQFHLALSTAPEDHILNKNYGNAMLRSGHADIALSYLEKALYLSPNDIEVLLDIGESLSLLGRFDEAIKVYRKILDTDRSQASAHYHLALLLKKKGLAREALVHYMEADRVMRYPVTLKYDFGNLLFQLGELKEAEKIYREFLAISPTLAMAYNNMGLVLINQGRLRDAIEQFRTALHIAPSFQLAVDNMRLASEQLMLRERKDGSAEEQNEFAR